MSMEQLFQPINLGPLTLPNRWIMSPVKLGYATPAGEVTPRHIHFYRRRAEGGAGLITTEPMYIRPNGRELPTQLGIHDDHLLAGLRELTNAVHAAGGRMMAHINHAGRAANPKLVPEAERVSAAAVPCPANGIHPRPLTAAEISEYVDAYAQAARRARAAGFDAVEIAFSHGYLIHQFLSPVSNRREDEYGGTPENRLRFGREVIAAVRRAVGAEFPIAVRLNATDYVEGGLTVTDAIPIAQALAEMGVALIHVSSGSMCESPPLALYPAGTPKSPLPPLAAQIRAAVPVPVAVAGRIRTPARAAQVLAEGQADLVAMGRPFVADPDLPRKAREGQENRIILCAACHQGCLGELKKGNGTSCLFNPLAGREGEIAIRPSEQPRRVMVVGGGPAGMQAAITAAQRGHQVTLYEREPHLGGQFRMASQPPHKDELAAGVAYQEAELRALGVGIHLGTEVTPETVAADRPDAVVVATGGEPLVIPFPGLEEANWVTAHDLLLEKAEVQTPSALVVGGGLVGLETADYLAARGKQVTVVEMLPEVGGDMEPMSRKLLLARLQKQGVQIQTNTRVVRLSRGQAIAQREGEEVTLPAETVVMALGVRSSRSLVEGLGAITGLEVHVIGDAQKPRKALEAIYEGLEVGLRI